MKFRFRFLFLSVLIHAALVAAVVWIPTDKKSSVVELEFDFVDDPTEGNSKPKNIDSREFESNRAPKRISIKSLMPEPMAFGAKAKAKDPVGDSAEAMFQNLSFSKSVEMLPVLTPLHHKIDSILDYPREFVLYEKQGYVTLDAYFDKNGYMGQVHVTDYSDPILKVHVLQVLDRFKDSGENLRGLESPIRLKLTFHFDLESGKNAPPQSVIKNQLSFIRGAKREFLLKGESRDGPQGPENSVGFDVFELFDRLGEHLEKNNHKKTKFDPFEKYKNDPRY